MTRITSRTASDSSLTKKKAEGGWEVGSKLRKVDGGDVLTTRWKRKKKKIAAHPGTRGVTLMTSPCLKNP